MSERRFTHKPDLNPPGVMSLDIKPCCDAREPHTSARLVIPRTEMQQLSQSRRRELVAARHDAR
jgi:hypothetical protein